MAGPTGCPNGTEQRRPAPTCVMPSVGTGEVCLGSRAAMGDNFGMSAVPSGAAEILPYGGWSRSARNYISASYTSPGRAMITASSNSVSAGSAVPKNARLLLSIEEASETGRFEK